MYTCDDETYILERLVGWILVVFYKRYIVEGGKGIQKYKGRSMMIFCYKG